MPVAGDCAMDTNELIQKGEKIYTRLKAKLESEHHGKFVAIDVSTEETYVGDSVEAVLESAVTAKPDGFFHIVHIGSGSVYRLGTVMTDASQWKF
ncbi:MAG: hypothetical protein HY304_03040 [candidate division Zixibacteria bacterium]|nr:hypothetical protein [candidate division Zixibacteria bacterium]